MPDRDVQRLDPSSSETGIEVRVSGGGIDPVARDHAVRKIRTVLADAGHPVLFATLRFTLATDPANTRPASTRLAVDLDGRLVRVHAEARTMDEAVELLERRLRDQLEHLHSREQYRRRH